MLSYKHQVDQIILISGDSDFVSASKLARREGIDFILDPLGATIKPALFEHIDGLRSCDKNFYNSASSKKNKVDISKTNKQNDPILKIRVSDEIMTILDNKLIELFTK